MGTTGSVEQRNAIKDVVMISDSAAKKRNKDEIMRVLQTFCTVFPLETPERRRRTDSSEENAAAASMDVKEKRLFDSVHRLLKTAVDNTATNNTADESDVVLLILDTFKRLLQWRELHKLVPKYSIKPFLTCMMWSPALASSVLEVFLMMKTRPTGLKTPEVGDKMEMLNKRTFADDLGFQVLGSLLAQHHPSSVLPASSSAEPILEASLRIFHWTYVGNKHTSDAVTLDRVTDALLNARLTLLHLAHHRSAVPNENEYPTTTTSGASTLRHLAADLLLELFSVADVAQVTVLQDTARDCGALLYMVSFALDTSSDGLEHGEAAADDGSFREKAVALVEMFCAGNSRSKAAMYRTLPVDLFVPIEDRPDLVSKYTLASIRKSTKSTSGTSSSLLLGPFRSEPRFSAQSATAAAPSTASMLSSALYTSSVTASATHIEFQRWLHEARAQGETWQQVLVAAREEHIRPNLIWRRDMLRELQEALRREIDSLEAKAAANALLASPPATNTTSPATARRTSATLASMQLWDAEQFTVRYASFQRELVVHGYFIEPLLPKLSNLNDPFEVQDHVLLAWHVLDRVAVEPNPAWRLRCIKCVRLLLRRYAMTFNGQLPVQSLLQQLQRLSEQRPESATTEHVDTTDTFGPFATECFLLFHVAISTSRTRTADSLVSTYDTVIATVVAALHAAISSRRSGATRSFDAAVAEQLDDETGLNPHRLTFESVNDDDQDFEEESRMDGHHEPDVGGLDAMVRAGVNVLAVIVQRARSYIPQVVAARETLVRLFHTALRPSTLAALLALVEQLLPHLSNADASGSFLQQVAPALLVACSNPSNAGRMTHAAAAFLSNYVSPSTFQATLRSAVGHDGCGLHLVLPDPTVLAAIFNADSVQAADVLWGATLRHRLFSSLHRDYTVMPDGLRRRLSSNLHSNDSGEFYDAQPGIVETSGDLDICVGHLFLRSFVEQEGSFRTTWSQTMYDDTIQALLEQLASSKNRGSFVASNSSSNLPSNVDDPMVVQVLLLRALHHLLPRAGQAIAVDPSVLEVLLSPLKRSLLSEVDQARGGVGLQLLAHLMTPPNVNASRALEVAVSSFALLQEVVDKTLQPRYLQFVREQIADPPQQLEVALTLVTALFELLAAVATHDDAAFRRHPSLLSKLFAYLAAVQTCPQLTQAALSCLTRLCQHSSLLPPLLLVEGGGVVFLSNLVAATAASTPDAAAVVTQAAALLHVHESLLHTVLVQLFTPGLLEVLATDGPAAFVQKVHSADDIFSARLIWTVQMQATLKDTLRREVANVQAAAKDAARWPVWDPEHFVAADSYRYLYADVADEVVVGGVYLRLFVQQDISALDKAMAPAKIQALAAALVESHATLTHSIDTLRARGGAPSKHQETTLDQLCLAIRKVGVAFPELELVDLVDDGFSDTESVGDDIANLVDMSPTNDGAPDKEADEDEDEDEGGSGRYCLDKQDSMQLDEIVV